MTWILEFEEGETFDDLVESIAKKQYEAPCPSDDNEFCKPVHHNWATAHPEDKQWALNRVAFVLREIGLDG